MGVILVFILPLSTDFLQINASERDNSMIANFLCHIDVSCLSNWIVKGLIFLDCCNTSSVVLHLNLIQIFNRIKLGTAKFLANSTFTNFSSIFMHWTAHHMIKTKISACYWSLNINGFNFRIGKKSRFFLFACKLRSVGFWELILRNC